MPQFKNDRDEVIKRAKENGLEYVITVGTDKNSCKKAIELAHRYKEVYAVIGIHPHVAKTVDQSTYPLLRSLSKDEKVLAIGEIGLDFYRNRSPRDVQMKVFREQIHLAQELDLPIVIHDRDAHRETVKILNEEKRGDYKGIFHCFSGDYDMARKCLDMGFYLSISTTVTYRNNYRLQEIARRVPLERLVVETDAPFLTPEPYRGKRNEPSYVRFAAEKVAALKNLSYEDVARVTSLNLYTVFGLGRPPAKGTIAYKIRDSLYLNITNRCTNRCIFCPKPASYLVKGYDLELSKEPSVKEVLQAIDDPAAYKEIVFCGFGEPLLRLGELITIAGELKKRGARIRIDTDGQANLVHKKNILPQLKGIVDSISVSLNAESGETYQKLCNSPFGTDAYKGIKEFILEARKWIPEVTATVVEMKFIDISRCQEIAEKELGVNFKLRPYNDLG